MTLIVSDGQTHAVDNATETGDLVLSGGTLDVASAGSGGTIGATTVSGSDNIYDGGSAASSFVTGVVSTGGLGSVFIDGGAENVFYGATADGTSVAGVASDGSSFFGVQAVFGVASATNVLNLGLDAIYSGGSAFGTTVSIGADEFVESGGYASGTIVDGGVQTVELHGIAIGADVSAGYEVVVGYATSAISVEFASGMLVSVIGDVGAAAYTIVNGGDELVQGYDFSATINSLGVEIVEPALSSSASAGIAVLDTVNGGVQFVFGDAFQATINDGGTQVVWGSGAYASGTTVNSGSFDFALHGGSAVYDTINSGSTEFVEFGGTTKQNSISGTQVVSSAVAGSSHVDDGGKQVLDGGGSTYFTSIYSGGAAFVESGGFSLKTFVDGGTEYLYGGSSLETEIVSGGTENVESGGVASFALVYGGGMQVVASGGFAGSAHVGDNFEGGTQVVSSGGVASGTFVFAYGLEQVLSGGTAVSTVIRQGGTVEIASGGSIGSASIGFFNSGGTLQLDDSQNFSGQIVGFDRYAGSSSASEATNYIDLRDIVYGSTTTVSWTESIASETLTVTDGTHTANLFLFGDYVAGDFAEESDGHGGTEIYDPANSGQLGSVVTPAHT